MQLLVFFVANTAFVRLFPKKFKRCGAKGSLIRYTARVMEPFSILSSVKTAYPKHPYQKMKDDILGKKYILSLAFIGDKKAKELNLKHRKKSYVPNVLSFPLGDTAGEIFIAPSVAKKESPKFSMTTNGYIGYLYIHALLHLKGLDHGDTMDKAEKKYCSKYDLR